MRDVVGLFLFHPSRKDQIDDVVPHAVVDVNLFDGLLRAPDLVRRDYRFRGRNLSRGHSVEDQPLLGLRGIIDLQFQHEPVHLGFG